MNLTEIQDLIKFVSKSGVSEVEIEQKDFKIVIKAENKSKKEEHTVYVQAPQQIAAPVAAGVRRPWNCTSTSRTKLRNLQWWISRCPRSSDTLLQVGPGQRPRI